MSPVGDKRFHDQYDQQRPGDRSPQLVGPFACGGQALRPVVFGLVGLGASGSRNVSRIWATVVRSISDSAASTLRTRACPFSMVTPGESAGVSAGAVVFHGICLRQPAGQVAEQLVDERQIKSMNGPVSPGVVGWKGKQNASALAPSVLSTNEWRAPLVVRQYTGLRFGRAVA